MEDPVDTPDPPKSPYPADGGTEVADAIFHWTAGSIPGRFDVQVSIGPEFDTLVVDVSGLRDVSYSAHLDSLRSYAWRVRAVNQLGPGEWTGPMKFYVVDRHPLLLSPAEDASEPIYPRLSWMAYPRAIGYWAQYSTDSTFTGTRSVYVTGETIELQGLDPGARYYWRVKPNAFVLDTEWSPFRSFITLNFDQTRLMWPEDGHSGVSPYVTFSWSALEGAHGYRVQIMEESSVDWTVRSDTVVADTAFTPNEPLPYNSTFSWRVKAGIGTGFGEWSEERSFTTAVGTSAEVDAALPTEFALHPPYPNPFNPSTTVGFDVPQAEYVRLTIYDALGRLVESLVSGHQSAGRHTVTWNAEEVPSGVYFVRMEAGEYETTKTLTVAK
jgi:hypothetical protein